MTRLDAVRQDFRFALGQLLRKRNTAVIAVAALAIGIGSLTAAFSAVSTVLLQPPPYKDSARLVSIWLRYLKARDLYFGPSRRQVLRVARAGNLEAAAGYLLTQAVWKVAGERVQLNTAYVSQGFFHLLGTAPGLGRFPSPADFSVNGPGVAVISNDVWRGFFGSSLHALGRALRLDGRSYVIVGIAPSGFHFPTLLSPSSDRARAQIWLPWTAHATLPSAFQANHGMIGRLSAHVTAKQLAARLNSIGATLVGQDDWGDGSTLKFLVIPLAAELAGAALPMLHLLLLAAMLVYLVAVFNVAGVFSERSWRRRGEIAMRLALGAPPARVIHGLILESCILAFIAGGFGWLLAVWFVAALRSYAPQGLLTSARVDSAAAALCACVAFAAGVAADVPSALEALRADPAAAMHGAQPGRLSPRRTFGRAVVVAEVAGTVVLAVICVSLVRSFRDLVRVQLGMHTRGVLTLSLLGSTAKYSTAQEQQELLQHLLFAVSLVPGVERAGMSGAPLLSSMYFVPAKWRAGSRLVVMYEHRGVSPGFFSVLGIPTLYGRTFDSRDTYGAPRVAVVNQLFARQAWAGSNPLSRSIELLEHGRVVRSFTVVGVVGDTRDNRLRSPPVPEVYTALEQDLPYALSITLLLRASGNPAWLERHVQSRIWEVLPNTPISFFHPLTWSITDAEAEPRFLAGLMSALGVISVVLAIFGVYSVFSYSVARRTHEIGLRMALGATPGNITSLVLGEGGRLLAGGIALGLLGSIVASRLLRGLLFGVRGIDPAILALAAVMVAAAVLAACYFPARAAARIDPCDTLREA